MDSFPERVAAQAAEIAVVKVLLTVLAVPFYVLGVVAAVIWLAVRWVVAAVLVGFADISDRRTVTDDAG